jgi:superfamily II DNA or RNA helicase/dsRNA-specific ribonuclease
LASVENSVYIDKVNGVAQLARERYCLDLQKKLSSRLKNFGHTYFPSQIRAFENHIKLIGEGHLEGLLKQPAGAGKTFWLKEEIAAIGLPALILYPKRSIKKNTHETLLGGGLTEANIEILEPKSDKACVELVEDVLDRRRNQKKGWAMMYTYQAHLSVLNRAPELFEKLLDRIGIIISDEAHRSLGLKTKSAMLRGSRLQLTETLSSCFSALETGREDLELSAAHILEQKGNKNVSNSECNRMALELLVGRAMAPIWSYLPLDVSNERRTRTVESLQEIFEDKNENAERDVIVHEPLQAAQEVFTKLECGMQDLAEVHLDSVMARSKRPHLHIRVTATPQLNLKNVAEVYNIPIIDSTRIQDMVEEGNLVMPTHINVGNAIYRTTEDGFKVTRHSLSKLCANERFVMEDGRSVRETVTQAYMEKRAENNGYLPGVAFCETIKEADEVAMLFNSLGVKAVRCTSSNEEYKKGLDTDIAQKRLELLKDDPEHIEVVATVGQVGEGWNVRTLRAALWYTIVHSPWRSLQGNGRINRTVPEDSIWPAKNTDNTFIIEPSWNVRGKKPALDESPGTNGHKRVARLPEELPDESIYKSRNAIQMMVETGEIDINFAVSKGAALGRLTFKTDDVEHVKLLLGSVHSLLDKGIPRDISKELFTNEELGWKVTGARLIKHHCPENCFSGSEARIIARKLWPEESAAAIFDHTNDDHLRKLIGSPVELLKDLKPTDGFSQLQFKTPDGNWEISGRYLVDKLHAGRPFTASDCENLLDRLWPTKSQDKALDYGKLSDLRMLVGSAENLQGDIFLKVFSNPRKNWEVSGRILAFKAQKNLELPKFSRLIGKSLSQRLYKNGSNGKNGSVNGNGSNGQAASPGSNGSNGNGKSSRHKAELEPLKLTEVFTRAPKGGNSVTQLKEYCSRHSLTTPKYTNLPEAEEKGRIVYQVQCEMGDKKCVGRAVRQNWAEMVAAIMMIRHLASLNDKHRGEKIEIVPEAPRDLMKSRLAQVCIANGYPPPQYKHEPTLRRPRTFNVTCTVGKFMFMVESPEKRWGEHGAAKLMLEGHLAIANAALALQFPPYTEDSNFHREHRSENHVNGSAFDYFCHERGLDTPVFRKLETISTDDETCIRVGCHIGSRIHIARGINYEIAKDYAAFGMRTLLSNRESLESHLPGVMEVHETLPTLNYIELIEKIRVDNPDAFTGETQYQVINRQTHVEVICRLGGRNVIALGSKKGPARQWAAKGMYELLLQIK